MMERHASIAGTKNHLPGLAMAKFLFSITVIFVAFALMPLYAAEPENVNVVDIAQGPMYGGASRVHPNLLLALSVEFPTTGIAYTDSNYDRSKTYIGYFNDLMCYSYSGDKTEGYFYPHGVADANHECHGVVENRRKTKSESSGGRFSGNFMNWVASSAIDMLRYAMTGGDRIIDQPALTVLQRAYLKESFYSSTNFPMRVIRMNKSSSAPAAVTPFDESQIVVVSCRNYIYFGSNPGKGNSCDKPGQNGDLGQYLARVKVCDKVEGQQRPDLCQQYGSNFKPVGEMQRNANRIRFGAFGYLMDNDINRYGGVLRAPMKYLGALTYDANFASSPNKKNEWDPKTGVFLDNPENAVEPNSGVVNYLNKFGRTGATKGQYKTYDPISEIFYEAMRYYKGLPPTEAATANMTAAMNDGFQVVKSWKDPVLASCQKNYLISIADANTHCDKTIPGNTRGASAKCDDKSVQASGGDTVNYASWTDKVGAFESVASLSQQKTGSTDASHYMAGIAYWANTQDIRTDFPGKQTVRTFSIDVDEYGNGDINNAKKRQLYYAGKYGGFKDLNGDGNPFITTDPSKPTNTNFVSNLEWEDKPNSGVSNAHFLAGQPEKMIKGIRSIFAQINDVSGTTAAPAVSTSKVYGGGSSMYQQGFNSSRWSGSLGSYKVALNGSGELEISAVAEWEAGFRLTNESVMNDDQRLKRTIFTTRADGKAAQFKWASIGEELQTLLSIDPVTKQKDSLGPDRLNYLHGMRAREQQKPGGVFRTRDSVLGDMINSGPVYVGKPSVALNEKGYAAFYAKHKDRTPVVYVGANDGMLHAFSAITGDELFAYVPNAIFPRLAELTSPGYIHQPYVDAVPAVGEAKVGSNWKTVLIGGFGGGAQGVYALDVSNPDRFGARNVLWEFTDKDDADMGNVVGEAQLARFRVKENDYRWFAVVASGLNNNAADGKSNAEAPGALFLLSLNKPQAEKWQEGVNYRKFIVKAGSSTLANGLSSPAIVRGSRNEVVAVYAGDLQGNLWKFDFTNETPFSDVLPFGGKPLFTALTDKGKPQPVTTRPRVVYAPGGGYMVLFGTGKFIENGDADKSLFLPQSFYSIYDDEKTRVNGRDALEKRSFTKKGDDTLFISGDAFVLGSKPTQKRGWYVDFLDAQTTGERSVTNPLVAYGQIFFNTLITSEDPCSFGSGRSYGLDLLTGLPQSGEDAVGHLSTIGFLSSPVLLDTKDIPGKFTATGALTGVRRYSVINGGTRTDGLNGGIKPYKTGDASFPGGQISWREIVDFRALQIKAKTK